MVSEDLNPFEITGPVLPGGNVSPSDDPPPLCDIVMSQSAYEDDDEVTATEFRMSNLGSEIAWSELKVWLGIPGLDPIEVLNVGANGTLLLPAGMDYDFGPLPLFTVAPDLPRGTYEFSSRMLVPETGELLSEDLNSFEIQ